MQKLQELYAEDGIKAYKLINENRNEIFKSTNSKEAINKLLLDNNIDFKAWQGRFIHQISLKMYVNVI